MCAHSDLLKCFCTNLFTHFFFFINKPLRYKLSRCLHTMMLFIQKENISLFVCAVEFSSGQLYFSVGQSCIFVHIKMQGFFAFVCVCECAERIEIFESVSLGWPEWRTTQAWARSPNKGAKPLHSD